MLEIHGTKYYRSISYCKGQAEIFHYMMACSIDLYSNVRS